MDDELLIEKYYGDEILPEELRALQEKLANDAEFRHRFLLYSQVEVALHDMVLFHNYMDVPNDLEKKEPTAEIQEDDASATVSVPKYLNNVLKWS